MKKQDWQHLPLLSRAGALPGARYMTASVASD
jgi:hypothetical protein